MGRYFKEKTKCQSRIVEEIYIFSLKKRENNKVSFQAKPKYDFTLFHY